MPRYSGSARINHWIVAISFVLLLLSGLSLFHPSLYWLSTLFGGGATVRRLHPWIGLVTICRKSASTMPPEVRVLVAGRAGGDAVHHRPRPLGGGAGHVEGLFGFKATMDQLRLAALIHAGAAVIAITIWIIHVYAAIWVRGTFSAMTRGFVTGGWSWRRHRKWLRKEVEKGEVERPKVTPAE